MKRWLSHALTIVVLSLPVLLAAAILAERMQWGPFALPKESPAGTDSSPPNDPPSRDEDEPPAAASAFDLDDYRPRVVVPRYLPPITDVPLKRPGELRGEVTDEELVLGVEIGGQARAYPINQLFWPQREVFNDTLGGRPIAATW
jgi:hypothetical protein